MTKLVFETNRPELSLVDDGAHAPVRFRGGRLEGDALSLAWVKAAVDEGKLKGVTYTEEAGDAADGNGNAESSRVSRDPGDLGGLDRGNAKPNPRAATRGARK